MLFARSIERGFCNFTQKRVSFPVEDPISLLDCRQSDGLCEMTLAGAGWTEKQSIFVLCNKVGCCQIKYQTAIHLLVEGEVEIIESGLGIPKLRFLSPAFQ